MSNILKAIHHIKNIRNLLMEDKLDQFIIELQDQALLENEMFSCNDNERQSVLELIEEINLLIHSLEEKNNSLAVQIANIRKQLIANQAYQNNIN